MKRRHLSRRVNACLAHCLSPKGTSYVSERNEPIESGGVEQPARKPFGYFSVMKSNKNCFQIKGANIFR